MRTRRVLGPLWVSLMIFALPAAAQTPDDKTPAEEGICDPLANATPGLQGLCVAMCEAQDCEATMQEVVLEDGTVETTVSFSPSCNASAPQILENYNKIKDRDETDDDPLMPCVQVACPCWAADEIENIADDNDQCVVYENWGFAWLYGNGAAGGREQAFISQESNGTCVGQQADPEIFIEKGKIGSAAYATCKKSVLDECRRRGLY